MQWELFLICLESESKENAVNISIFVARHALNMCGVKYFYCIASETLKYITTQHCRFGCTACRIRMRVLQAGSHIFGLAFPGAVNRKYPQTGRAWSDAHAMKPRGNVQFSAILAVFICMLTALPGQTPACFYSSYGFNTTDSSQSRIRDLLFDKYAAEAKERPRDFCSTELQRLKSKLDASRGDPAFMDDYAYLLYRTGQEAEAERIWIQLLKADPNRFSTLCNYATACQFIGRYADAAKLLGVADRAKPGFRSGAEGWHLRMLSFMEKQRENPGYSKEHLFADELTAAWKSRKDPPNRFTADIPRGAAQGIAELLHQFPAFGEAWLALAMLLERNGDYHDAKLAYRHALRHGTGQLAELKDYLPKFEAYEESRSPLRAAGIGMLRLVVLAVAGFIVYRIHRFYKAVQSDRKEAKQAREALEKRDDRR